MIGCENSGHIVSNDFAEVSKIVKAGAISKSIKDLENIFEMVLTRLTLVLSPFRLRKASLCSPYTRLLSWRSLALPTSCWSSVSLTLASFPTAWGSIRQNKESLKLI